ncbi:MAG TPA: 6-phospho-beta-glucosidase [Actinomycetes bacterium]|nr:6-phospho-beta-glucosidase [Actinomycetes bacterium]
MKVAVIGGGSTYTPELIDGLIRRPELPISEIVLHDTNRSRLDVVGAMGQRMAKAAGWAGILETTLDLDEAVSKAGAVLLQLRVGGQAARYKDETIPVKYSSLGQETTGAGGFMKALRTVPVVLDIAERTQRLARPDAWIVDFTNPVGIVTRALLDGGHRAIGLCNVAIGFQRRIAQFLSVEPQRVELEQVGLNHLSWIRAVRVDDVEVLPRIIEEFGDELADEIRVPVDLIRTLDAIPSYYLHYFYCQSEALADMRSGPTRAEEVMALEHDLLEMYADPSLSSKPELLEQRGGAYYSEAAAQLLSSLINSIGDIQVVDVRNDGTIEGLPDAAVVEVPCVIDSDGAHPLAQAPLAPEMLGLVQHVSAYEQLTVQAALSGDRSVALRALLANPLVGEWSMSTAVLDDMIAANIDDLPAYWA